MRRRRTYKGDPRWINTRFAGTCDGCGAGIERGAVAYYYPNSRTIYGKACGCADSRCRDFEAPRQDDDFMSGGLGR